MWKAGLPIVAAGVLEVIAGQKIQTLFSTARTPTKLFLMIDKPAQSCHLCNILAEVLCPNDDINRSPPNLTIGRT